MTPTIPTLVPHSLSRSLVALYVLGAMILGVSAVEAALTTDQCLFSKRQAWGNRRKCEATEQGKQLKGKPADLAKCVTKFQAKLAKVTDKAAKDAVPCRYATNADGTVTDYDTGLQWEKKDGEVDGVCFLFPGQKSHCVNHTYSWYEAQTFVTSLSTDGTIVSLNFIPGTPADWRLPTITELQTIVDTSVPGCDSGSACIDPIFGPTYHFMYWSSLTFATNTDNAWGIDFSDGEIDLGEKESLTFRVRAVRGAF